MLSNMMKRQTLWWSRVAAEFESLQELRVGGRQQSGIYCIMLTQDNCRQYLSKFATYAGHRCSRFGVWITISALLDGTVSFLSISQVNLALSCFCNMLCMCCIALYYRLSNMCAYLFTHCNKKAADIKTRVHNYFNVFKYLHRIIWVSCVRFSSPEKTFPYT